MPTLAPARGEEHGARQGDEDGRRMGGWRPWRPAAGPLRRREQHVPRVGLLQAQQAALQPAPRTVGARRHARGAHAAAPGADAKQVEIKLLGRCAVAADGLCTHAHGTAARRAALLLPRRSQRPAQARSGGGGRPPGGGVGPACSKASVVVIRLWRFANAPQVTQEAAGCGEPQFRRHSRLPAAHATPCLASPPSFIRIRLLAWRGRETIAAAGHKSNCTEAPTAPTTQR